MPLCWSGPSLTFFIMDGALEITQDEVAAFLLPEDVEISTPYRRVALGLVFELAGMGDAASMRLLRGEWREKIRLHTISKGG